VDEIVRAAFFFLARTMRFLEYLGEMYIRFSDVLFLRRNLRFNTVVMLNATIIEMKVYTYLKLLCYIPL
jgi:hypothetical protein